MKNLNMKDKAREKAQGMHAYEKMRTVCTMPECICGNEARSLPDLRVPSNDLIGKRIGRKVDVIALIENAHCPAAADLLTESLGMEFFKLSSAVCNLVSRQVEMDLLEEQRQEQERQRVEEEAQRLQRRQTAISAAAARYGLKAPAGPQSKGSNSAGTVTDDERFVPNVATSESGAEKARHSGAPNPHLPQTQPGHSKKASKHSDRHPSSSATEGQMNGTPVALAAASQEG